ncbi:hypothetical protein BP6252_11671 [Coleophoma cylindrospora]|uniref:Cytochrome P450 n=1 Tax=Coleophoma cylindrospora TaxID=1849047 RepID=A0A3D8QKI8_9HELO|nr:hypothetical protein BP6252_11671 [Coleophoma cylindrospora]
MSELLSSVWPVKSVSLLAVVVLSVAIVGLWWYILPKPISGSIPYNKYASRRVLGDVPELLTHVAVSRNPFTFIIEEIHKHDSPIIQLFIKPMKRPIVIISEPRETEDILLRRGKEFDRGYFFKDIFQGNIPYHHLVQDTNEQFKAQRKFINDAMSPTFLREVGAPRIHEAVNNLINLWRLKTRLAEGRPFRANVDLKHAIFDAIWVIAIGENANGVNNQLDFLSGLPSSTTFDVKDSAVVFPEAQNPGIFDAVCRMCEAFETIVGSPFPQLHHKILKLFPGLRKAYSLKDEAITRMLEQSRKRFAQAEKQKKTSALDYFLHRDDERAVKIGNHLSEPVIRDELFGFLEAGHETTSTSLAWIMKFFATYPNNQTKLRNAIQAAFPDTKNPTPEEILNANIPYLDAFIEESMRVGQTALGVTRRAIVNTTVLGHPIPAGTEVYMMFNGPGYVNPPFTIADTARESQNRERDPKKFNNWNIETLGEFEPDRWIDPVSGEYDPRAGPMHIFGLGVRGCWGKKLAYVEMRVTITLLMLNFSFGDLPRELADFEGQVFLTHEPRRCHVKLTEL